MAVTLDQLLHSPNIIKAISQIKTPMDRFQNFYGMGIGGRNNEDIGGDLFSWDIFDKTRKIASGRAPGVGPRNTTAQKVGNVTAHCYRAHEKITLLKQRIFRNRRVGGRIGEVDVSGQDYIRRQEGYLVQRFRNNREFMISRMFRGGFSVRLEGEDVIPVELGASATDMDINFQIPSTNQGTVNSIFAGDWQTVASATPNEELLALNAYSEELTGYPLAHAWCTGQTWDYLERNVQLKDIAGSANVVFNQFERTGLTSADGIQDTGFTGVLRSIPWLTWHIYEGGLEVDGTYSKSVEDDRVVFTPDPDSAWLSGYNGSELVAKSYNDQGSEEFGMAAWATHEIDPASVELKMLDNWLPALFIPKAVFYATVSA